MMKKIFYILAMTLVLSGCNYLEQNPEQLNTIDKVFTNRTETEKWFARIYSGDYFPNELYDSQYYNHYMFATDEAANLLDAHIPNVVHGNMNPTTPVSGWDRYYFQIFYQAIRHCNIFLENVGRCEELGLMEKERMIAEARFMRVMYHWWLFRVYGPIPIIDHSIPASESGNKMARNSADECIKWFCDEIDAAFPTMESAATNKTNTYRWGFPTQEAALAMKSRILLYYASPLYNGNTVYASWKNNNGKQLMPQTYDNNKWKVAADAAKAIIDAHIFSLKLPETTQFDDIVLNLRQITTEWNDEIIWARPAGTDWWFRSCIPAAFLGWNARNSVTLEYVNNFFMADGTEAPAINSWFSPRQWSAADGNGTQANTFMMFVDREPRFYASTMFPNQLMSFAAPANHGQTYSLEFWYSGNCGVSKSSGDRNSTGFSQLKNIPTDAFADKGTNTFNSRTIPFPVIRLAEIYLNYAEAMNEWGGVSTHSQILPYINEIRDRAGIPGYGGTYTKEQMRDMIRKERDIELAWEVHHFFDVKRWFIAHGENGKFNHPVHGLDVTRGTSATDPAFFTPTQVDVRTFNMEHYFEPIKATEVAFNTDLVQAPFY